MTSSDTPADDARLENEYRASLTWLYRQSRGPGRRDPARMAALVSALGLSMPPRAVHVVGTNGKGTVAAMTAAGLSASGVRSGCFTSPHVEDFRERISVDCLPIGRARVVEFVASVRERKLPFTPAFFELTLALALDHFCRSAVDFAAFEAGVGARYDATAVLENVAAVAITPIALDHLEVLGPDLAAIAGDKAAALRPGVPAASAAQDPEARAVLETESRSKGAPVRFDAPDDPLFDLPAGMPAAGGSPHDPVRYCNQRVAVATMRLLGDVSEQHQRTGLTLPPLPGRGERFRLGEVEVLLDGAHDPAAGRALAQRADRDYVLLFGALPRKQGEATLRALEARSSEVFLTNAGGEPSNLAAAARTHIGEPSEALAAAVAACPPGGLLVIAGSLYLAGELRPLLRTLSVGSTGPGRMERLSLEGR